jgi:hypothetical protein
MLSLRYYSLLAASNLIIITIIYPKSQNLLSASSTSVGHEIEINTNTRCMNFMHKLNNIIHYT